jgi:hypothetical protein
VDAKNLKGLVGKDDALQVLNYLRPYGAGSFGLIITRNGQDEGCQYTIREYWKCEGRLLLVASDEEVKAMLRAKETGTPPEVVLRQMIEDFRLSL